MLISPRMSSLIEREGTIPHAGSLDVFPLFGGIVDGFHNVQNMIGECAAGPMGATSAHSISHIGETNAAKIFRIAMSKLNFLPFSLLGAAQIDRSTERVGVGNAQAAF